MIFLLERGLDYKGVALVDGFYMVSSALLDYPTGGLADRYGRGLVAALGCLFFGLGLLSYSLSTGLLQFLFSEFLAAIGSALYSGALLAWLVDSLKEEGRQRELADVLGKARILSLAVSAVGGFVGGLLAERRLEIPFVIGAAFCFTAFTIALLYTRGRGEAPRSGRVSYTMLLKRGARVLLSTRPLILLTLGSSLIALAVPSFNLTWAPQMESLGASKWLLGVASSVFMATAGLSGYAGGRLAKLLGYRRVAVASLASMSAAFALLTLVNDPYAFIAVGLLYEVGFGSLGPVISAWINEFIPSGERATVISLRRTLLLPFSALGMAAMGVLSDAWSPRLAYAFGAVMATLALLVYSRAPEKA